MIHTGIQMTPNNCVLGERRGKDGSRVMEKEKEKHTKRERELAQMLAYLYEPAARIRARARRLRTYGTRHAGTTATRGAAGRLARRGSWRHSVGSPGTLLSRSYEAHRIYDPPSSFSSISLSLSRSLCCGVASRRCRDAFQLHIRRITLQIPRITDFRNKSVIPSL